MLFKSLLPVAAAIARVSAIEHGDEVQGQNGDTVKYHQIAKGMWSGIPIHEWNETVHKRSDFDHGIDTDDYLDERTMSLVTRGNDLEARNFQDFCQSVSLCATAHGDLRLVGCVGILVQSLGAAAQGGQSIWNIISDKTFLVGIAGGTIATIGGIRGEKTLPPIGAAECSTSNTELDAFSSAISAALAANPDASSIAIDVTGPTFSYTATVTVNKDPPPPPQVGQCFNA